jgi:hypothetical protein
MKARMRTLDKAYEELKTADPNTEMSKYSLRQLLMSGKVPVVEVGRLRLVDMSVLDAYLRGEKVDTAEAEEVAV